MRMHVDKAGGDHQPAHVECFPRGERRLDRADRDNPVAANGHVARERRLPRSVDDRAASDDEVEWIGRLGASNGTKARTQCGGEQPFQRDGGHDRVPSRCGRRCDP